MAKMTWLTAMQNEIAGYEFCKHSPEPDECPVLHVENSVMPLIDAALKSIGGDFDSRYPYAGDPTEALQWLVDNANDLSPDVVALASNGLGY